MMIQLKSLFYTSLSILALFTFSPGFVYASKTSASTSQTKVKVISVKDIPNQKYNLYLTGQNPIYNHPGILSNAKVAYDTDYVNKLVKQNATFMAYRVAKTSNGYTYYKIVSLHHSVRGWVRDTGISAKNVNNAKSSSDSKQVANSKSKTTKVKIISMMDIPKQTYDKTLNGKYQIFNAPAVLSSAQVSYGTKDVQQLVNQKATFMTYRVAKTSDGQTFYEIVSLHHSVRGWINANGIQKAGSSFSYNYFY